LQTIDRNNLRLLREIVAKDGKATVCLQSFDRIKAGFEPDYSTDQIRWLRASKLVIFSKVIGNNSADGFLEEYAMIEATPEGRALVEERQKESVETFWHKTYPTIVSTIALLLSGLAFLYSRGWLR